jgi:hypothetical protein
MIEVHSSDSYKVVATTVHIGELVEVYSVGLVDW